jgi:hypothetical protein
VRTPGLSLVVLAGAIAGAGIMKMLDRPHLLAEAPPIAVPIEAVSAPAQTAIPPQESMSAAESVNTRGRSFRRRSAREAVRTRLSERGGNTAANPGARVQVAQEARSAIDSFAALRSQADEGPGSAASTQSSQEGITFLIPPAHTEPEKSSLVPPPPPEPHKVTLNAGILIPVRLVDGLSTERSKPGDLFTATLDQELIADDFVIAERGARVEGRVVAANSGNRQPGVAGLTLALTRLQTSDGQNVSIRTDSFERHAEPVHVNGVAAESHSGGDTSIAATLPPRTQIRFRLGQPVTLTEHAQ